MGVFDKELTRLAYECDTEKKQRESRKMSSVCLDKWVDSHSRTAYGLNIQIFKHTWDIQVASL